ncbi:MAG: FecCD family ABC transporter permease [Gaiellaceae bacterium]
MTHAAGARMWLPAALLFLAAALLAGVLVGPVDLGAVDVVRATFAHVFGLHSPLSGAEDSILWDLRLPRVILAAIVGGTLAVAGASYQGVFRNPLADPYLLGAAAGAGLGATLVIAYAPGGALSNDLLPLAAFIGAGVAVIAAYVLGRAAGVTAGAAALILAGVTITAFFTALQTFVQQQNVDTVQEIYSWLLGRLTTAGWRDVAIVLPYAAASWAVLIAHGRLLDVLAVGDDEAASLGVHVARVRLLVVVAATIATAAAVAVAGLIGFVGIIVPHTIRLLAGGSYRLLLPLSVIVGAGFLVFADVIARTVMAPAELPIGVVTMFFGAPFFAVVLRTSRRV